MGSDSRIEALERRLDALERAVSFRLGEKQVVTVEELRVLFGYKSKQAMMAHVQAGRFPIPLFKIVLDPWDDKRGRRHGGKQAQWVASLPVVRRYFEDVNRAQMEIYEREFRKAVLEGQD